MITDGTHEWRETDDIDHHLAPPQSDRDRLAANAADWGRPLDEVSPDSPIATRPAAIREPPDEIEDAPSQGGECERARG